MDDSVKKFVRQDAYNLYNSTICPSNRVKTETSHFHLVKFSCWGVLLSCLSVGSLMWPPSGLLTYMKISPHSRLYFSPTSSIPRVSKHPMGPVPTLASCYVNVYQFHCLLWRECRTVMLIACKAYVCFLPPCVPHSAHSEWIYKIVLEAPKQSRCSRWIHTWLADCPKSFQESGTETWNIQLRKLFWIKFNWTNHDKHAERRATDILIYSAPKVCFFNALFPSSAILFMPLGHNPFTLGSVTVTCHCVLLKSRRVTRQHSTALVPTACLR